MLELKPHPEGGYYKETYRSDGLIKNNNLPESFRDDRNYSTCIYFLLTSEKFSAFHKVRQDEIWHFYKGSPIKLHFITSNGIYKYHIIGNDLINNQLPQLVVKGGTWFAAEVLDENSYGLVGCTVSPGFSFEDFELGNRNNLCKAFPEHIEIINHFIR